MKFFHRYESTIHGNYRKAYLCWGLLTGLMLVLYLLVRWLMGRSAESAESYLSDGILLVGLFVGCLLYRNSLPERKVTLKELMLFGMGAAVVACLIYGLYIWLSGMVLEGQTELMARTMFKADDFELYPVGWWSALCGIVTGVKMAVLGGFGAFISALILKNEKGNVKK